MDGLLVLSVEDYLQCFWPALTDTLSMLQSLVESMQLSVDSAASTSDHSSYWAEDRIKENLRKVLNLY